MNEERTRLSLRQRNISVVICDADILRRLIKSWWRAQSFQSYDFNINTRHPWFSSFQVSSNPLSVCPFVIFLLAVVLTIVCSSSIIRRLPLGIFKLFLFRNLIFCNNFKGSFSLFRIKIQTMKSLREFTKTEKMPSDANVHPTMKWYIRFPYMSGIHQNNPTFFIQNGGLSTSGYNLNMTLSVNPIYCK
jgi:hypothetical protein